MDTLYDVPEWADELDAVDAPETPTPQWLQLRSGYAPTPEEYVFTNARIVKSADAYARMCGEEIKALQARKKAHEQRGASARKRIAWAFDEYHLGKRLKDGVVTVSMGKPRTKLVVEDLTALPREWIKVVESARLADLQAHYKDTGEIPDGCDTETGAPVVSIR